MRFPKNKDHIIPSIAGVGILNHLDNTTAAYMEKRYNQPASHTMLDARLFVDLLEANISILGIARLWGVSSNTMSGWVKHYYNEGHGTKVWRTRYKQLVS